VAAAARRGKALQPARKVHVETTAPTTKDAKKRFCPATHREGFDEERVEVRPAPGLLLELDGFGAQRVVGQLGHRRARGVRSHGPYRLPSIGALSPYAYARLGLSHFRVSSGRRQIGHVDHTGAVINWRFARKIWCSDHQSGSPTMALMASTRSWYRTAVFAGV
jgi:hypothetical protein